MTGDLLLRLAPSVFNLIPALISVYLYGKSTEEPQLFKKAIVIETSIMTIMTVVAVSMLNHLIESFTNVVDAAKVQQIPNSAVYYAAIYFLFILVHMVLIICVYRICRKEEQSIDSDYDGVWVSTIPEIRDGGVFYHKKSDRWTFKAKNNRTVSGTIIRTIPSDDDRRWDFAGFIFGEQLLIAFAENKIIRRSAGVMLVRKVAGVDEQYKGYYYEFDKKRADGAGLLPIPIQLRKERA